MEVLGGKRKILKDLPWLEIQPWKPELPLPDTPWQLFLLPFFLQRSWTCSTHPESWRRSFPFPGLDFFIWN